MESNKIASSIVTYCNVDTHSQQNPPRFQTQFPAWFPVRFQVLFPIGLFLVSFVMLSLSALSPNFWFLALFGLIPLFWAIKILGADKMKWGIFGSLAVGFGHSAIVVYPLSTLNTWWWTVSSGFFWEYKSLVYFAVGLLIALFGSLFTFGCTFFIYSKWLRKNTYAAMVILPVAWTVLEWARVKIIFGLEWGIFGQPLGENLFFARSAVFGGIFTLSFLAVIINFCIFLFLENFNGWKARKFIFPLTVISIILTGLAFNSRAVADSATENSAGAKNLTVAVISPNLETSEAASSTGVEHIFNLIAKAVTEKTLSAPNLIILPENIFPLLVIDEKTLQPLNYDTRVRVKENFDRLSKISAEHPKVSFIIGLHTAKNDERSVGEQSKNGERFNSAVVFEEGKIVSIYNKQNLLPFTEKSFSFLEAVHIDPLTSGERERAVETQYGNFAPLICSEILISQNRANEQVGARAFINLSNDNIFNSERVATYNKIITRLRAIQTGQAIIRSSKGGFSGIFDQTGREIPMQTGRNSGRNKETLFGAIDIP